MYCHITKLSAALSARFFVSLACRAHSVAPGFRNHHGIDAKRDVSMRRALQGFITVMTFIAADPGMAHTGSSSVINAKQANHTSGVYSGTQGFGIPLTMDGLTTPLTRNTATSLLLKVNPAHWRKWKRNTQSRRQPGSKPSGIEQLNALALG